MPHEMRISLVSLALMLVASTTATRSGSSSHISTSLLSPVRTITPSASSTPSASVSRSSTHSGTPSRTITRTSTSSPTSTRTSTHSRTNTATYTSVPTSTRSISASRSASRSLSASRKSKTLASGSQSSSVSPTVLPTAVVASQSPVLLPPAAYRVSISAKVVASVTGASPTYYVLTNDSATSMDVWGSPAPRLNFAPAESGVLVGTVDTPPRIGFFNLTFSPRFAPGITNPAVKSVTIPVELSCSDGNVCNGSEQLVARRARANDTVLHDRARGLVYECAPAPRDLCDDGIACTIDTCVNGGICQHIRNTSYTALECPDCVCIPACTGLVCGTDTCGGTCGTCPVGTACSANQTQCLLCTPDCSNSQCGNDGCGGTCGTCTAGEVCSAGLCAPQLTSGTCANPISITSDATSIGWSGTLYYTGDNSLGINEVVPTCNLASDAPEIIYQIDVPPNQGFVGLWAMVGSCSYLSRAELDTTMYLIQVAPGSRVNDTCLAASANTGLQVDCSDDANPPGGVGSAVYYQLRPGHSYLLAADSYSAMTTGPYCLNITFVPGCTPDCNGAFCGDSGCPGFSCGECNSGTNCSYPSQRCQNIICQPSCEGRACGDDGCGGSCGVCGAGTVCASDGASGISKCAVYAPCNSLQPTCTGGCVLGQYCGTDCTCHYATDPLADLAFLADEIQPTLDDHVDFSPSSCALEHGCIGGLHDRRLLRFSTNIANVGIADYSPPDPAWEYPWVYKWNSCHGHYHTTDALRYLLLDQNTRSIVVFGKKASYCIEDSNQMAAFKGPKVQCDGHSSCDYQGLQSGWEDVYGPTLDCQWLDVTDVLPGNYTLQLCANLGRTYQEQSFENNCVEVSIIIPVRPPRPSA